MPANMWRWSGGRKRRVEGERILNANRVIVYYSLRQTVSVLRGEILVLMICSAADPRDTSVSFTPHQILLLVTITTFINNAKFPPFFNRIPPLSLLPSLPLSFLLTLPLLYLAPQLCRQSTACQKEMLRRGLGMKWNNVQCFLPFCLLFIRL